MVQGEAPHQLEVPWEKFFILPAVFLSVLLALWFIQTKNIAPPLDMFLSSLALLDILIAFFSALAVFLLFTVRLNARFFAGQMSQELIASREWFRELYDESPVAYIMLSPDARVRQPNKAALRLFGGVPEDLYDTFFSELFLNEDRSQADQFITFFKRSQPINEQEIRIVKKDGTVRWVLFSLFILEHKLGTPPHGLASFVDITERKEMEKVKVEFVSLASHQLRTPLSSIKWRLEILLSGVGGELNKEQRHDIERAYKNNEIMIDLVRLLLNVSRIEMGTLEPQKKETNIKSISEDVLEELSDQIKKKELSVAKVYDEVNPLFFTDAKLFRIIIHNLLSNAVKYTPEKGQIKILFTRKGSTLVLDVVDNGYGISSGEQEKIFTKLFRAENAKQVDASGTGLGLYLTRSLVELLGGSIKFISEENKGTTFTVQLEGK